MSRPRDLSLYIERTAEVPFDWLQSNCGHFAADWVEQVEGRTDMTPAVAAVATPRTLTRRGDLVAVASAALQRQTIAPALAQAGDLVSAPVGVLGRALGICCGVTAVFRLAPAGLVHIPMSQVDTAWPVGRP